MCILCNGTDNLVNTAKHQWRDGKLPTDEYVEFLEDTYDAHRDYECADCTMIANKAKSLLDKIEDTE
jgi:hypothetical protein